MIRLPDIPLSTAVLHQLERWQAEVDAHSRFADRVEAAQRSFEHRNKPGNRTFAEVRSALTVMCSGAQRCGYCEDSAADEVEHIWPKDLYPERVFAWRNYLYACGSCNGPKNNRFAVFPRGTRKPVEVSRPRGTPVRPPPQGSPALIDPRHEDPMAFLMLELQDTFYFEPIAHKGTKNHARADYTLRLLRLNSREHLRQARENAFIGYRALLREYVSLREQSVSHDALSRCIHAIQRAPHFTVWKEMQRQHRQHPELRGLFRKAPEALGW
ncbi:hypothetical protein [Vitiosangium sp. GDMCC 1.1324]|uniref:hypothetical protein n=1 Tax=Vitiosangium sp. (strain GDMCC 1.1324) TaxID=2138576 RepID=UPI000D34A6FF|nr:hypothetical protein [Vitiosangium sp. GDMCC 1.1324]PTL84656.1 hypothetical protein DAT35_06210 [Vitiosangium sp. GDMCC 1.1324]